MKKLSLGLGLNGGGLRKFMITKKDEFLKEEHFRVHMLGRRRLSTNVTPNIKEEAIRR